MLMTQQPRRVKSLNEGKLDWDNQCWSDDSKGLQGIYKLFGAEATLSTESIEDSRTHDDSRLSSSTGKLFDIREETMVEKMAEEYETVHSRDRDPRISKSTISLPRSRSGSSVKDFARSVRSSIRRNLSQGSHDRKYKEKHF